MQPVAHCPRPNCSKRQRLICGSAASSSPRRQWALSPQTADDISAMSTHTLKIPMSGLS